MPEIRLTFFYRLAFIIVLPFCSLSNTIAKVPESRRLNESTIKKFRESGEFDYLETPVKEGSFWDLIAKFFSELFKIGSTDASQDVWTIIFYFAVAGLVIFLLWKWVDADKSWFLKSRKKQQPLKVDITEEDIHAINFSDIIQKAIAKKNYRKATRYLYLYSLKELTDTRLIHWQQGKTNETYIGELKSADLKSRFIKNTYLYEFIWYGNFKVDEPLFADVSQTFQSFLDHVKQIRR